MPLWLPKATSTSINRLVLPTKVRGMGILIEEALSINDSGFRGRTDSETLNSKFLLKDLGDR